MLAGHAGARALKELGVEFVAGVAGESFLPLLEGMRNEGIEFVNTAHESGAAFLALGHARLTDRPGFAAVTRGPGASNALIGVYEAMKSETPMVLIIGQVDTVLRHRHVIQEMELVDTFAANAKAVVEVTRADRFAPALLAAYRSAVSGRRGPVVLSVPTDHLYGEAPDLEVPTALRRAHEPRGAELTSDDLDLLLDALRRAERPLLLLGRPFTHRRHGAVVDEVATALGLGVVGGHSCLDVVDHTSASWIGCNTVRSSSILAEAFAEADLVLSLGDRLGDRSSQGYQPTAGRVIAVSQDEVSNWDEYFELEHLRAEPVAVLHQIARASGAVTVPVDERRRWITSTKERLETSKAAVFAKEQAAATVGVAMSKVVEAVDEALPSNTLIVSDVGTFNDWFTRYLPFTEGRRYVGPTANPMGFALPVAIGAHRRADVERSTVLVGDGGFLMSGMELATLARLGESITVFVFVNGVWGSIARDQDSTFGVRYGTELGVVPDVVALAGAFGIEGRLVDDASKLPSVLEWAFSGEGPKVVEVRTDPQRVSPADLDG